MASQKTVWHRPQNCDIIPLAKLQILKQNTEPEVQLREKETTSSTGTISKLKNRNQENQEGRSRDEFNRDSLGARGTSAVSSGKPKLGTGLDKRNAEKLASPSGRHSFQHRLPTVEDFGIDQNKFYNESGSRNAGQGPSSANRSSQKYMDSSKSSDSSLSSYRVQEGGSLRVGNVHNKNARMLQESSSSHNIPHVPIPGGNSSDLTHSPSHTSGTPLMKKKLQQYEAGIHSKERERERDKSTKHQSFDYAESELLNF